MLVAVLLGACAAPPPPPPPPAIDFKQELRPFGEWLVVKPYGRLWHPSPELVGQNFVPYFTGGQWVHTAKGWAFDSKWAWGELVFRHGRWVYVHGLDWLWWEDAAWAPAWVQWKVGPHDVGWSPLAPPVRSGEAEPPRWVFLKTKYLAQRDVERFAYGRDDFIRAQSVVEGQPVSAKGPSLELLAEEGGLTSTPDGGFLTVELSVPGAQPAMQAVEPTPEPVAEPAPPPPPVKKKKAKKKR